MDVRLPTLSSFEWKLERTQEHSFMLVKNALQWLHTFNGVLLSTVFIAKIDYIYLESVIDEWMITTCHWKKACPISTLPTTYSTLTSLDQTRDFAVIDRRLTATATAWPLQMFKMGSKLTIIFCTYGLRSYPFGYLCYMCHKRKSHGRFYSFSADTYPVLYVQYLSRTVSLTSAVERSDAVGSGGAMPSPTWPPASSPASRPLSARASISQPTSVVMATRH